jgi:GR25 family glycosyltransferase involved in LPS biosynthesis
MINNILNEIEVYCINLKDHEDRRLYIKEHFKEIGINDFSFIQAFYPKDMNSEYLSNCLEYGMKPGEAACGYSSLFAIKQFLEKSDKDYLLVCEDDVDLSNIKKIKFNLSELFKIFKINVDCIQLAVSTRTDIDFNPNVRMRGPWDFNTTCYILTKSYAEMVFKKYFNKNVTLDNFNKNKIFDYRNNSFIYSSPVAEYVVYNSSNVFTVPIFTYNIFESLVNNSNERMEQNVKSRKDFLEYWNRFEHIYLEDLVGL